MASTKAQAERLLPVNIEAERAVLGYLLAGGRWREEIAAHDFSTQVHQSLWHGMRAVHVAGEPIGVRRLALELGERKAHLSYLVELVEGCYPEMRIAPYVAKLREATAKRDLLQHAHILIQHIHSNDRTAEELVTMATDAFNRLRAEASANGDAPAAAPSWPEPVAEAGFYGLAGEVVRSIEPHSESDPAALLVQFLVAWGSLIGRGPYYLAEEDRHHTNLFCVLVGVTSKGRKGTSWSRMRGVLEALDAHWAQSCLVYGLGSGEALIDALGQEDHRRLVLESEFARLLAILTREGTTVSSVFRQCWDSGEAHVTVRVKEAHVNGGHLSLVGHITRDELLRRLSDTEIANGFGNRILWCCARRSKKLPFGGGEVDFGDALRRLEAATAFARRTGNTRVRFDAAARQLWQQAYDGLSEGRPGLFGAVTGRSEAQVVRLALIYALLDQAPEIREPHLRAALAVWNYCEASARYVWRDALGDPTADELLRALRTAGELGCTRWDLHNHFSRNKTAGEVERAVGVLAERGLIRQVSEETGGRPVTRYWAV